MKITIIYYRGDEYHDEKFEFEPSFEDLQDAIHELFAKEYNISVESAKNIIGDLDLYDELEEYFEEEIKEYFEEQAMEEWQQYDEDKREGHSWSESWFH